MGLLDYFLRTRAKGSANVAKERLQILVAHDRAERHRPPYLQKLKREILDVIGKYVDIDPDAVSVNYEQGENHEVLELNIVLPEAARHRA